MTAVATPPRHAPHAFAVRDNELLIGGQTVSQLAARMERTPFFAYDRGLIRDRVARLRAALPTDLHLHYALKANPHAGVAALLAGLVDGFDVASGGELDLALAAGMAPARISFAGPGKDDGELRRAARAGVVVNLESLREMEALARIGYELGLRPRAALRINPDFELKSSGMKMGGGPKPFGVDAEQAPEALARMARLPLEFMGFHIFAGSQNLRAEALMEVQSRTLDLARRLAPHAPGPVCLLNLGGGFGIPYFPGETPLDLAAVGRHLAGLMPELRATFPEAECVLELGRYLVGEAGVYVCRVLERKVSRGQIFLITDGGLHHHLAASGNFGQVLRKNYPVLVGNRVSAPESGLASVTGRLCTPLDLLADRMELGHAREGDLIVILQSGAYGPSASPAAFLGHPPALEVLV